MTPGQQISATAEKIAAARERFIEEREARLYPVVRNRPRLHRWVCTTPDCENEIRLQTWQDPPEYCRVCGEPDSFVEDD